MSLKNHTNFFSKKVYGILGYPIDHSLSPYFHQFLFKLFKVPAVYLFFPVENLKSYVMASFFDLKIQGISITAPYKALVYSIWLKEFAPSLRNIKQKKSLVKDPSSILQITNTLKWSSEAYYAFNTDFIAVQRILKSIFKKLEAKVFQQEKNVIIFGIGSMTKLFCYVLLCQYPSKLVYILGRREEAFNVLRNSLKQINLDLKISNMYFLDVTKDSHNKILNTFKITNLFINLSPLGMNVKDIFPLKESYFHPDLYILDLIYTCKNFQLRIWADIKGSSYEDGLRFFIWQALEQAKIWNPKIKADLRNFSFKFFKKKLKKVLRKK